MDLPSGPANDNLAWCSRIEQRVKHVPIMPLWITDCDGQEEIRRLISLLIANLSAP